MKRFNPVKAVMKVKIKRATYGGSGKTNSDGWRSLSYETKVRDNFTCQKCRRHKKELKSHECLEVDHIIPVCRGGTDSKRNLWTICSTCHKNRPFHSHLRQ